jgi:Skp family chaperone for outer membrane proteins
MPISVGVFTLARTFAESTDGRAAIDRVKAIQDRHRQTLGEKQKAIQGMEQSLQSGGTLSEAERSQRARELERAKLDLQRLTQDAEAELTAVQREVESTFLQKMQPALQRVAKARGIQMVVNIDDGSLLWSDPSLDLTDDLIREMEPEFGSRPNLLPVLPPAP